MVNSEEDYRKLPEGANRLWWRKMHMQATNDLGPVLRAGSPWFHHPELRDVSQPTVLHCQAFFNRHAQHLFSLHRVCRYQEPAPQPELCSCAFYCCLSNLQPVQPSTAWGLNRGTQLRPAAVPFHLPESQQPCDLPGQAAHPLPHGAAAEVAFLC